MWIKKIQKRKIQMLLIGIIAAVSAFMLASSIGVINNIGEPMDKLIQYTKAPTLYFCLYKNQYTQKAITDIKNGFYKDNRVSGVKEIDNVIYSVAKIRGKGKYFNLSYQCFLTYNAGDFGTLKFLSGKGELKEGECYISSGVAQAYNISVNDTIIVENPNGDTKLKVSGIYADPYSVTLAMGGVRIYVNSKQLREISGINEVMITVYSGTNVSPKEVVSSYEKNNNRQILTNILGLDLAKMSAEISGQILGGIIASFALIILVVSAIVIRVSIFDSIIKEYKTIGIYKAMGYSSKTIVNIYFKAYSAVIISAAVVGAVLSKFLVEYTLTSSFKSYGTDLNFNYVVPVCSTVIIVAIIMLISVYSVIRKAKTIPPVKALTFGSPISGNKGLNLSFLENNFSPFVQSIRKIFSYKKFSLILFIVLFICSYIVTFSVTLHNNLSILKSDSTFWFGLDDAHYRITITGSEKENDVLKWVNGNKLMKNYVKGAITYSLAILDKSEMKTGDGGMLLNVYSEYDNAIKEKLLEGRNPRYDNEIAITKKLQNNSGKSIGDYIDIYINGHKNSLLITGIYQSMLKTGMNARVLESTMEKADRNYVSTNISFNLKDDGDFTKIKIDLKNKFGNSVDVFESNDFYKDMLGEMIEPAIQGMMPFVVLVILIGAINVFSIIMLMNLNSRKQFCIYKSLGYNSVDLIASNICYIMLLGVIAAVLGVPVFKLSFSKIINTIFGSFGIYNFVTDINGGWLLISLLISIVIYTLSTCISSFSISKFKVNELNEE